MEPAGEFLSLFSVESTDLPRAAGRVSPRCQAETWRKCLQESRIPLGSEFFYFSQFEVDTADDIFHTKKTSAGPDDADVPSNSRYSTTPCTT